MIRHSRILDTLDIIGGSNPVASLLASRLGRNMAMFANVCSQDSHYLSKVVSLPTLTLATTLKMVNYNWCTRSLDEDTSSLKSFLADLKFCNSPSNLVDSKLHVNVETTLYI